MELSKILSIAGKPGLFRILHQSRGGVVVASLVDGKKISIGQTQRVSTLSDISVYKVDGDEPLERIFEKMLEFGGGKEIELDVKDNNALRAFFLEIVPEHDEDRVYPSDIKKLVKWFNMLLAKGMFEKPEPLKKTPEPKPEKDVAAALKVKKAPSKPVSDEAAPAKAVQAEEKKD